MAPMVGATFRQIVNKAELCYYVTKKNPDESQLKTGFCLLDNRIETISRLGVVKV